MNTFGVAAASACPINGWRADDRRLHWHPGGGCASGQDDLIDVAVGRIIWDGGYGSDVFDVVPHFGGGIAVGGDVHVRIT